MILAAEAATGSHPSSADFAGVQELKANGGAGYSSVVTIFVPKLRYAGVKGSDHPQDPGRQPRRFSPSSPAAAGLRLPLLRQTDFVRPKQPLPRAGSTARENASSGAGHSIGQVMTTAGLSLRGVLPAAPRRAAAGSRCSLGGSDGSSTQSVLVRWMQEPPARLAPNRPVGTDAIAGDESGAGGAGAGFDLVDPIRACRCRSPPLPSASSIDTSAFGVNKLQQQRMASRGLTLVGDGKVHHPGRLSTPRPPWVFSPPPMGRWRPKNPDSSRRIAAVRTDGGRAPRLRRSGAASDASSFPFSASLRLLRGSRVVEPSLCRHDVARAAREDGATLPHRCPQTPVGTPPKVSDTASGLLLHNLPPAHLTKGRWFVVERGAVDAKRPPSPEA